MTCIIGLECEGRVYIGADSASSNGWFVHTPNRVSKVFRIGPFLIGYTGSWRMGQLLRYHMPDIAVQHDKDAVGYIVRSFVEPVRTMLKEQGFAQIESNQESGGQFVLGYRGHVYGVQDDYSVLDDATGLVCAGSGADFAYGAMAALVDLPPRKRIRRALAIAAQYDPHVSGPFVVRRL